jgi:hypothetical protein
MGQVNSTLETMELSGKFNPDKSELRADDFDKDSFVYVGEYAVFCLDQQIYRQRLGMDYEPLCCTNLSLEKNFLPEFLLFAHGFKKIVVTSEAFSVITDLAIISFDKDFSLLFEKKFPNLIASSDDDNRFGGSTLKSITYCSNTHMFRVVESTILYNVEHEIVKMYNVHGDMCSEYCFNVSH